MLTSQFYKKLPSSVKTMLIQLLILVSMLAATGSAFLGSHLHRRPFLASSTNLFDVNREITNRPTSGGGKELNWMDRRVPLDMENNKEEAIRRIGEPEEYDIGISGVSFQTGPLSTQIYEAMMSRQDKDLMSDELKKAYQVYALDFTAKEATRTALKQNGFDAQFQDEDMDGWGTVDSVQLLDPAGQPVGPLFDNWNRAVDQWTPGQGFNFVAREVRAKLKEIALQEVLDSLDPDGSLRETALGAGMSIPSEDLQSLTDLANEVKRRCEEAPRGSSTAEDVYKGDQRRGYAAIPRSELLVTRANIDGSENQKSKCITTWYIVEMPYSHELDEIASADAHNGRVGCSWLFDC